MRRATWQVWTAITVATIAVYVIVPGDDVLDGWLETGYKTLVGCIAGVAILAGALRRRPPAMLAWMLFGSGILANALGALVSDIYAKGFGQTSYPNIADGFWLMLYPGLFLGVGVLIRARGSARDWASLVDATTVATGLGLLSWVFLMVPVRSDHTLDSIGQIIVMAYPVGDIVVLAMLLRLVLAGGVKNTSFWLICASLLTFLAGDATWAVLSQLAITPGPPATRLLDTVFLAAYALFAGAAWHPSVRVLGERAEANPARLTPAQLIMLTGATLIAPAILGFQVSRHQVTNGVAIVIGSVALFLLVVTRMAQLVRQVEAQSRQLHALSRSDALTGLSNRRAWSDELPAAIERARRDDVSLCVAMIDLDHFKIFNDEFGHQAGDRLLKSAAAVWSGELRTVDQLGRYGGEEFILLLPNADVLLGTDVLARLRAITPAGQTFSAGLAAWDGTETSEELIARADQALYAAKQGGRNRTEVLVVPAP
jgi:diguanylate cyclase (GGDEF)-like protein